MSEKKNREFVTARLWGVRDSAPYLHEGRATTLKDAIVLHGGEAEKSRTRFERLSAGEQDMLIAFLYSLRTPVKPQDR